MGSSSRVNPAPFFFWNNAKFFDTKRRRTSANHKLVFPRDTRGSAASHFNLALTSRCRRFNSHLDDYFNVFIWLYGRQRHRTEYEFRVFARHFLPARIAFQKQGDHARFAFFKRKRIKRDAFGVEACRQPVFDRHRPRGSAVSEISGPRNDCALFPWHEMSWPSASHDLPPRRGRLCDPATDREKPRQEHDEHHGS